MIKSLLETFVYHLDLSYSNFCFYFSSYFSSYSPASLIETMLLHYIYFFYGVYNIKPNNTKTVIIPYNNVNDHNSDLP